MEATIGAEAYEASWKKHFQWYTSNASGRQASGSPCDRSAMLRIALLIVSCLSALPVFALPEPFGRRHVIELERRQTRSGRGTWYNTGLGNCGVTNNDDEPIVAISKALYDENGGSDCGKYIQITNTANGKTATGLIEDSCPGCGEGDIDLSPSLFEQLAPLDQGVVQVSWTYTGDSGGSGGGQEEDGGGDEGDEGGDEGDEGDEGDGDESGEGDEGDEGDDED